jgi:hypothetical protein
MLSAKSDGKALALGDTVAGAEGAGEVAGVCADKPMANAIEQNQTIINLFIGALNI